MLEQIRRFFVYEPVGMFVSGLVFWVHGGGCCCVCILATLWVGWRGGGLIFPTAKAEGY